MGCITETYRFYESVPTLSNKFSRLLQDLARCGKMWQDVTRFWNNCKNLAKSDKNLVPKSYIRHFLAWFVQDLERFFQDLTKNLAKILKIFLIGSTMTDTCKVPVVVLISAFVNETKPVWHSSEVTSVNTLLKPSELRFHRDKM